MIMKKYIATHDSNVYLQISNSRNGPEVKNSDRKMKINHRTKKVSEIYYKKHSMKNNDAN